MAMLVEKFWAVKIWPEGEYFMVGQDGFPKLHLTQAAALKWLREKENIFCWRREAKPRAVRVEVREIPAKRRAKGGR